MEKNICNSRIQEFNEFEGLGKKQPLLLIEGQNKRKGIQFGLKQVVASREKRGLHQHPNNGCEAD